jgi:hypothetical protein
MTDPSQLDRIEALINRLHTIATDPDGRVQLAQTDALRAYGMAAMTGEVLSILRDQVQALAETMVLLHAQLIILNRASIQNALVTQSNHVIIDALAQGMPAVDIAAQADAARTLLYEAAQAQLIELEAHASAAKRLLRMARMDARAVVEDAANQAKDDLAAATQTAITVIEQAAEDAS